MGDREEVEDAVGRAAGRGDAAMAFSSARAGDDRRGPDVAPDEVHDQLAGRVGGGVLGRVLCRDAVEAGRRQPDELNGRAHRVGGVLATAGARPGARRVLDLVQLVEGDLAGPVGADRLVDVPDAGPGLCGDAGRLR